VFDTSTLAPNYGKYGAGTLSKMQIWGQTGQLTPGSLLAPRPVPLLSWDHVPALPAQV